MRGADSGSQSKSVRSWTMAPIAMRASPVSTSASTTTPLRSLVGYLVLTAGCVERTGITRAWVPGAQWRHPEGPGGTLRGRDRHQVTHVAYADAEAYAIWAGKELPTEAEWEPVARGGLEGRTFVWGTSSLPRAG
jgi:hypothetical protein